jgi:predicted nuclease of restriction endonuclease-like RecB superfamily
VLTADLAHVRRRGDELRLVPIDPKTRARLEALAAAYQAIARASVGRAREEVEAAFREVEAPAAERRLAEAVLKLVRDGCVFEEPSSEDAVALRRELFHRASAARRADGAAPGLGGGSFDRAALVAAVADERGTTVDAIERGLFADRAGALRLLALESPAPAHLAARFELFSAQAVLLRAVKLVATVKARDAATYRYLFRQLKFLRLLPLISSVPGGGYRLEIDGPFSLFQAVTRYGLQLGLALPAVAACEEWRIEADVRWGVDRRPARFLLGGGGPTPQGRAADAPVGLAAAASAVARPPDEVSALVAAFERLGTPWRVDRDPAVLDLPGVGLCVPDLAFEREREGRVARVYLEVLGYWSREAVFRRVDLARAGLPHRILFAVSRDLRVSEEVLQDTPSAALYVFTRVLNARAILERLEALGAEEAPAPKSRRSRSP